MTDDYNSSIHPPLPPTTEEDRFSWLRLLRSRRVGVSTFYRLMAEHGSAQNALDALPEVARNAGVEGYEICPPRAIEAELKAAKAAKARLLCLGDGEYPKELASIPDAPPMLWCVGNSECLTRPMVAVVGARNASSLGTRMARALATDLGSAGITVVSGLARGIDTSAHIAALKTGTVAVMAGGVDVIYPSENAHLGRDIAQTGALLSEQPIGFAPRARHFPPRNRIVSGLSKAVIIVEAATRSGSLITARDALDQGREVLAVPGHPFDARAAGCNMLIRDGAQLVRNADDVITALGQIGTDNNTVVAPNDQPELPVPQPERRNLKDTVALHQQILNRLGPAPVSEDQLIRDLDVSAKIVAPVLIDLELEGQIERQSGGLLSRLN